MAVCPALMEKLRHARAEHSTGQRVDKPAAVRTAKEGGLMAEGRGNGAGAVMLLEEDAAKALVRQGQEAGFLTQEEIALGLDELDLEAAQIDEFYQALEDLHIDVVEAAPGERAELDLEPEAHDVSTDALQLFLKDIGRGPLLTAG